MAGLRFLTPVLLAAPWTPALSQRVRPVAALPLFSEVPPHVPRQLMRAGTLSTAVDQVISASVSAALIGYALYYAVDNPGGSDRRVKGDAGYTPNANSAYVVGSFAAATVTVMWSGRSHGQRGTWAGTSLGGAVVAVPLLFLTRDEPLYLPVTLVVLAPVQALAATIGYQLSRSDP